MSDVKESSNNANKLLIEALTKKLENMMNEKISSLREEIIHVLTDVISNPLRNEQVKNGEKNVEQPRQQEVNQRELSRDLPQRQRDCGAEDYYCGSSRSSNRRPRCVRDERIHQQDNFGSLKLRVPHFQGKNDPDVYLEWEKKIEMVFDCQFYTNANKVKVAATEFSDYALCWWDQLVTSSRRNLENLVETWT
ncbi:hypothetical protein V5N11_013545 [Cardamine amara subsp. amara]|uniref:Retrotransposon gag domain-containing protein n=1 Tax=Cardamine amara subsp. amara TaxID=228776 RepID=A0ABD1BER3_CARAN